MGNERKSNSRGKVMGGTTGATGRRGSHQVSCMPARSMEYAKAGPQPRKDAVHAESPSAAETVPIWLAALLATHCQATGNGEDHVVRWNCFKGRALYTNARAHTVRIEPLGVTLQQGHTLAVGWAPGETAYSLEIFRQFDQCA